MPALLKMTFSAPKASTAVCTIAATCERSVTSTPTDVAEPPSAVISAATDSAAAALRSATTIFPPSAAMALHAAVPMPAGAAVTITTCPDPPIVSAPSRDGGFITQNT
jgi:hypothetical protein